MAFQKKQNNGADEQSAPTNQKSGNIIASSGKVTLINMSTNPILLNEGVHKIMLQPKVLKTVDKSVFEDLKKNDMIKIWLDKGLLKCNYQADKSEPERKDISVSADDAPDELKNAVEKVETNENGDNVKTVSAQVTKQEAAGSITLD